MDSSVVPVVCRDFYTIGYEFAQNSGYPFLPNGALFVHVDVKSRWTSTIKRRFLSDIDVAHELLGRPVYTLHTPNDAKHEKFIRMSGFTNTFNIAYDAQGRRCEVWCKPVPKKKQQWAAS